MAAISVAVQSAAGCSEHGKQSALQVWHCYSLPLGAGPSCPLVRTEANIHPCSWVAICGPALAQGSSPSIELSRRCAGELVRPVAPSGPFTASSRGVCGRLLSRVRHMQSRTEPEMHMHMHTQPRPCRMRSLCASMRRRRRPPLLAPPALPPIGAQLRARGRLVAANTAGTGRPEAAMRQRCGSHDRTGLRWVAGLRSTPAPGAARRRAVGWCRACPQG